MYALPMWESMIDPGGNNDILLYILLSLFGLCLEILLYNKLYDWILSRYQRRYVRMKRRVTYRPSKAQGIFGALVGGVFVLIGLAVVIPCTGPFGILWTLIAAGSTGLNVYYAFGTNYIGPEIRIEDEEQPGGETHDHIPSTALDAKHRLEQLESLKTAGLIDGQEYQQKRNEILKEL